MYNFDRMIVQSEMDYRAERLRRGRIVRKGAQRVRIPFIDRHDEINKAR